MHVRLRVNNAISQQNSLYGLSDYTAYTAYTDYTDYNAFSQEQLGLGPSHTNS